MAVSRRYAAIIFLTLPIHPPCRRMTGFSGKQLVVGAVFCEPVSDPKFPLLADLHHRLVEDVV